MTATTSAFFGRLGIAGGVVVLVMGLGSAVIGGTVLATSAEPAEPVFFSASEQVPVPDRGIFDLGPLVVYGSSDGLDRSITLAMDCVLLSSTGQERARLGADVQPDLETDRGRLEALVSTEDRSRGGSVTCRGPQASSAEPLALETGRGTARTAGVVALALSVVAMVVGTVWLGVGVALRRRR